jgi:hypothetical protein
MGRIPNALPGKAWTPRNFRRGVIVRPIKTFKANMMWWSFCYTDI